VTLRHRGGGHKPTKFDEDGEEIPDSGNQRDFIDDDGNFKLSDETRRICTDWRRIAVKASGNADQPNDPARIHDLKDGDKYMQRRGAGSE